MAEQNQNQQNQNIQTQNLKVKPGSKKAVWLPIFIIFTLVLLFWFLNAVGILGINTFTVFDNGPRKLLVLESSKGSGNIIHFIDKDSIDIKKIKITDGMPTIDYQLINDRAYFVNSETKTVNWVDDIGGKGKLDFTKVDDYSLVFLVSPDNNKIAWSKFKSEEDGKTESIFYVADINGKNKKQLMQKTYDNPKYVKPYQWSPENNSIYYFEDSYSTQNVVSNIICGGLSKLKLEDNSVSEVFNADMGCIYDLSLNEKYALYNLSNKEGDEQNNDLVIYNLNNQQRTTIDIDDSSTVESAIFSLNSRNIIISLVDRTPNQPEKHTIWSSDLFANKLKIAEGYAVRSWFSNNEILANKLEEKSTGLYKINLESLAKNKFSDYQYLAVEW